ncbi:glycosyltransferase family 4 protein [Halobellus ordinarius]|uniref:glycosyltransferase family 4 protein n=1 Tax=Halobellus ordinarius TaxID=3075120 RepID=UPI0028802C41|nr:glycosyltransferase family 4 protein [Halobellus sp. ZY16]
MTDDRSSADPDETTDAGRLPADTTLLIVGPAGYKTERTGGIGRYIAEQRRHLDDRLSYDVIDTAIRTPSGPIGYLRALVTVLAGWLSCLLRRRPDIVHVHTSQDVSFLVSTPYVLLAGLVWNRPVVLHVHGSSFDEYVADASRPLAALQSAVFGASDAIVVLSEYWRDALAVRAPAEKLVVLPNAIDPTEYVPDPSADPPHLVFVSNHIERKGIVELTRAIDSLLTAGVEFRATIAGAGPLSEHAEALASKHDEVEYIGFVPEERKRELLSEANVYVLPTYAEGLPIAVLEAMAGANAIVSTDVGAIPSVVDDRNGAVVPPGDVDELTVELDRLLSDPAMIERMGRVSRRRVEASYAWDGIIEDLLALYAGLVTDFPEESSRTGTAAATVDR